MSDQEQSATDDSAASHDTSGHEGAGGHAVAPPLDEVFNREEIAQFGNDDTDAGQAIGKMLSIFFLYTVLAMAFVAYWTYRSVTQ